MKRIKQVLSLVLAMVMILSLGSTSVQAAGRGQEGWSSVTYGAAESEAEDAAEVTAEEPAAPAEETEAPAEEPAAPAEEPEVPAEEPAAPAEEPAAPAEEPAAPVEETTVPAEEPAAPAEEPAAPAPAYPAVTLAGTTEAGVTVRVESPEGALPEGAYMTLKDVSAEEVQAKVSGEIAGRILTAVDITFLDNADNEIQPNGNVAVSIKAPELAEAEAQDLGILHINEEKAEAEELTEAENAVEVNAADENAVAFVNDAFSIYAIVSDETLVKPRVTYHFLSELKEDGTADPFAFVNKAGDTVDYQILKDDEKLEDPGQPVTSLEKNFLGWFIVNKDGDTYTFPAGGHPIDFDDEAPVKTTVAEGDKDAYVAPRYGQAFIVTFWDNAKGSPEDQMHIVSKRVVYLDEGQTTASVRVDNVTVPSAATQALSGWTSDDYKEGVQTTYTLSQKPVWDEVTKSFNLYPIFSDGHWLRFAGGPAGSGAGYRSAIFVTTNTQTSELASLGTVNREGYTFTGWYYKGSNADPFDGTEAATDESGNTTNAQDLLNRVQSADGDTTLYAHWTGKQVTYKVATWFENPNDDEYSYGELISRTGTAGTMTSVTASAVEGFTAESITQQEIKGDGTTIVNVYYKRNIYEVKFYNRNGRTQFTELTITAKYGADIHDQWPGLKEGTQNYSTAWYSSTSSSSTWILNLPTMPLNGANYYQYSGSGSRLHQNFNVQSVTGGNSFDVRYDTLYNGSTSIATSPDDYVHIEGFRVNAATTSDATRIQNDHVGDDDAVSDSTFNRSIAIGTTYSRGIRTGSYGNYTYTLNYYYLRNQYTVSFNTLKSGAVTPNPLTGIYYEANIADTKASEIATLNNQYKIGETTVDVTGEGTYVFQGWYDNADGMGEPFNFNQKMPAGNITLYAKWERIYYLIDIDPMGGEILPDINEVTYTWLQYGDKIERYNIRRDYVEAASGYTGDKYYYVSVLSKDDPNAHESSGYYWSGYRKGFYIKTTDVNNAAYSWWKDNGFIQTDKEYMPATTNDNYAFVGWYNKANDQVYDFDSIVTGETAIYAKWRRSGLFSVQYHTINGSVQGLIGDSLVATDASYADQATTKIAYTPEKITSPDGKKYVFVGWKQADPNGFDPNYPGDATLVGDLLKQGDDYLVDANYADAGHYIHLVAIYEPAETNPDTLPVTTITFDPNFPADAGTTTGTAKTVEGIPVNTEIDLGADSFTFDLLDTETGTTVPRTEDIPKFTAGVYVQTGWNTQADGSGDAFKLDDIVGVDNLIKSNKNDDSNTLYAIWEAQYFYIYHSSTGKLEAVRLDEVKEDGTYDLTEKVGDNLYGGWYTSCGAVTEENVNAAKAVAAKAADKMAAVTGAVIYDGTALKNGSTRFFAKANIIGNQNGKEVTPHNDDVFYLKEVPNKYLGTNARWIYDKKNNNKIEQIYFLTCIDDTLYDEVGFLVIEEYEKAKVAGSFKFQQRYADQPETVTSNDLVTAQRGYLGIVTASKYIDSIKSGNVSIVPYWKTLDGVEIISENGATFYCNDTSADMLTADNIQHS